MTGGGRKVVGKIQVVCKRNKEFEKLRYLSFARWTQCDEEVACGVLNQTNVESGPGTKDARDGSQQ